MNATTDPNHRKPDGLRDIYRDAVAEDRGPSSQSTEAILAHAAQRAAQLSQPSLPQGAPPKSGQKAKSAANDRFWLRHALGGLAAVGLVGWLMLQHAAWWDGTDQGIGAEPATRSTPSVPAAEATGPDPEPAAEAADAGPSSTVPVPPVLSPEPDKASKRRETNGLPRAPVPAPAPSASAVAHEKVENRPAVSADDVSGATENEAFQSTLERRHKAAPAAKMQSRSPAPQAEVVDAAPDKTLGNAKDLSQLPWCAEDSAKADPKADKAESKARVQGKAQEVVPTCRPRRPQEKPVAPVAPEPDAADTEASPER